MVKLLAPALSCIALVVAASAQAQVAPIVQRLYDGPAPGSERWQLPERAATSADGTIVSNVRDPGLLVYLPDAAKATGDAVILLPGGGLRVLGIDQKLLEVVKRLNDTGTAAFILKYRVLQTRNAPQLPTSPAAEPARWPEYPPLAIRNANANPSPNDPNLQAVLRFAVADTRRAFDLIRSQRRQWRVDPSRIGLMGTSAGGGVAIGTLIAADPQARPRFIASIFGPALQDVTVPANAPPLFLVTETGHGPVTDGLQALTTLWRTARRPVELHIFDVPPGKLRNGLWLDRFFDWLREQKLD
ncbi:MULTISPECIES: alpha/beta hydrolase [unclassified Sphingomonas]|uniref:alpha/beta hydrolase n=1 Tax=unclassified Sphingomonas TaxID=196159 RepID=UPI0006F9B946|nr:MULTISPECIES: alpha/beta hydrolase [unclassified Sphingomonas]KQM27370.1 hypothetical protein ASE58_10605 [Sphingomonas sp. Leaf9]KQM43707.1 hypothetical protein ASE57_10610 [Sphingomonas sp. Leaf11]